MKGLKELKDSNLTGRPNLLSIHTPEIIQKAFTWAAAAAVAVSRDGQQHPLVFNTLSPCPATSLALPQRAAGLCCTSEWLCPAVSTAGHWSGRAPAQRAGGAGGGDGWSHRKLMWPQHPGAHCELAALAYYVPPMQIPRTAVHSPAPRLHPEMTALWSCHSLTLRLSMAIG